MISTRMHNFLSVSPCTQLYFQTATSLIEVPRGSCSYSPYFAPSPVRGPGPASKVVSGGDHCHCAETMETEVRSPHSIHCVAAAPALSHIYTIYTI